MMARLRQWLPSKWRQDLQRDEVLRAYARCFGSVEGHLVMQHLLDTVYCQVYEGTDAIGLAAHNGQRAVVHNLLLNVEMGTQPDKYRAPEVQEEQSWLTQPS